jgi:hypothetical protein
MIVPWRVIWVGLAAVATVGEAVLLRALVGLMVGVVITVFTAMVIVIVIVMMARAGVRSADRTRRAIRTMVGWATVFHTAWIITVLVMGDQHFILLTGALGALAALEEASVLVIGVLYRHQPLPPEQRGLTHAEQITHAALTKAGFGHFRVMGHVPLGDLADPHGLRFRLLLPGGVKPPEVESAAELIAVALSEILNISLESRWVQLRKTAHAGTYTLTVILRDVMGQVIPYVDVPEWTSMATPVVVGYGVDLQPYCLHLAQHGRLTGKTRSGKSMTLNLMMAHVARCRDGVLWVGSTEKTYDAVAGWLEPYAGCDDPLPFDWVTQGPVDVLAMLIGAMNVARWRQSQPMSSRVWPHLTVVVDEASFALRNRSVTGMYQGQTVTMSQMAGMIMQGAGSAHVWLWLASQRSTNDHYGDHGGDVGANVGFDMAFMSKDWAEVGRTMGDYTLPMPTHQGEFWLSPGNGEPVLLKGPYIQEVDPTHPHLSAGMTVSDVAWARRHMVRRLDAGSACAAGPVYANRHTRYDAAMEAYLRGTLALTTTAAAGGVSVPEGGAYQEGYAMVMDALGGGVAVLTDRRTRPERIKAILGVAEGPMTLQAILAALHADGDPDATYQSVANACAKLVTEAHVERADRGQYVTAATK